MNKHIVKAFVDTREQKMILKTKLFFKKKGIEIEEKTLGDYGDVSCLLTCGEYLNIERKTMEDFVTSYISGHVQEQALRMNKVCKNYCIIIYGDMSDIRHVAARFPALRKITQKSVDAMIRTIQMIYKCPVFVVEDTNKYFLEIMNLAKTINSKNQDIVKAPEAGKIKNRTDVNILRQAGNIGERMALNLLKEFGTPEKVLNASREELLEIKGVGDATVATLRKLKTVFYEGV